MANLLVHLPYLLEDSANVLVVLTNCVVNLATVLEDLMHVLVENTCW